MNKTELLDKYARDGESRLLLARVLDQQQRADQRGIPTHTAFLSPAEQAMSADLLMAAAPGQGVLHGGYADAERKLWGFLPDWLDEDLWLAGEDCPLAALEVKTPKGAKLTHRDYLGSLMGLGITRENRRDGGAGHRPAGDPAHLTDPMGKGRALPCDPHAAAPGPAYPHAGGDEGSPGHRSLRPFGRRCFRRVLHPPQPCRRPHPRWAGDGQPPAL